MPLWSVKNHCVKIKLMGAALMCLSECLLTQTLYCKKRTTFGEFGFGVIN